MSDQSKIMKILRPIQRPDFTDANYLKGLIDSSPQGSVGAPGGVNYAQAQSPSRDPAGNIMSMASMIPGAGDVVGPAADVRMFAQKPESRTLKNAALFGAGLLPAVPSLAYLMNRGGAAAQKMPAIGRSQRGIIGHVDPPEWNQQMVKARQKIPLGTDPTNAEFDQLLNAADDYSKLGADTLRVIQSGGKTYVWPADMALHADIANQLKLKGKQERGILIGEDLR